MDDWFSGPAIVTNRFMIHADPAMVRIAFGEQIVVDGEVESRAVITLRAPDALELAHLLLKLIAQSSVPEEKQ